ncbi:pyrimidine-nucleoside phosphorylase [Virgibacillus halotolerans]|uniref:thymidine phosphorylase n=1 Tax=Virgibacillus halotolerans TaxID=1071053 RepID=UPI001961D249|nr:thymidine phosphorylase [Virgibacillus halotolerans]MBM7598064.1 pyrimidine-nucleoside phosphorylase [Virgibacillus halotolerans]
MNAVDIINKKKNENLTYDEIKYMVDGYTNDSIPDYQMSAFLMTIYFKGLSLDETSWLTEIMVDSGDQIDLSFIDDVIVDKHSTGGVGDKVSLIITPIVASLGIPVAKMSGRGLGHTGGTVDKLEAIKGFKTELSDKEFEDNVKNVGVSIIGQSKNLVPADKKIYALRDVTGTVDSIPLIASSIMSKKIAGGADAIVLDIKVGSGAFMKSEERAEELANTMVSIGNKLKRKVVAILTRMDQPLGNEVGNLNEVQETIDVLTGKLKESDVIDVSVEVASQMVLLGNKADNIDKARQLVKDSISNGKAYDKFNEFITAQGGNMDSVTGNDNVKELVVKSDKRGYIEGFDTQDVGHATSLLGAGRLTKNDVIDPLAGITVKAKIGDEISKGDDLFVIRTNHDNADDSINILKNSVRISDSRDIVNKSPIIKIISS